MVDTENLIAKNGIFLLEIAFNDLDFCNFGSNVSEYANLICKLLHDCRLPHKPRKLKPWFTGELCELHQELRQNDALEQAYMETNYKRAIRYPKKQFLKEQEERIVYTAENDRRKFWDLLKIRKGTTTSNPIDTYEWYNYFEVLFNSNKPPPLVPKYPQYVNLPPYLTLQYL